MIIKYVFSFEKNLEYILYEGGESYHIFTFLLFMLVLYAALIGYINGNNIYIHELLIFAIMIDFCNSLYNSGSLSHIFDLFKLLELLISFGVTGYIVGMIFSEMDHLTEKLFYFLLIVVLYMFLTFIGGFFWYIYGIVFLFISSLIYRPQLDS